MAAAADGVDYEQAGVVLRPFSTSHRVVRDHLNVRLGDTVLIAGVSGGMRLATMQVEQAHRRTRYRNDATRPRRPTILRELGADATVVTDDAEHARAEVRALTGGEGVVHAVDFTGSPECCVSSAAYAIGRQHISAANKAASRSRFLRPT